MATTGTGCELDDACGGSARGDADACGATETGTDAGVSVETANGCDATGGSAGDDTGITGDAVVATLASSAWT